MFISSDDIKDGSKYKDFQDRKQTSKISIGFCKLNDLSYLILFQTLKKNQ